MSGTSDLLKDLVDVFDAELNRAGAKTRQGALRGMVGAVVLAILGLGILLVSVGVFLHVSSQQGPLLAGLWVGGALFILAGIVAGIGLSVAGQRAKAQAETRARLARSVAQTDLEALLKPFVDSKHKSLGMAAAALIAGVLAGRFRS